MAGDSTVAGIEHVGQVVEQAADQPRRRAGEGKEETGAARPVAKLIRVT